MSAFVVRLPDVGEGVAEAELVAWHVSVGDTVTSDTIIAEVLTDKATVEIYAPVGGTITARYGEAGDVLAIGSEFVTIETASHETSDHEASDQAPPGPSAGLDAPADAPAPESGADGRAPGSSAAAETSTSPAPLPPPTTAVSAAPGEPPRPVLAPPAALAPPAVRQRARTLGIDLSGITGSGPQGRVTHDDLDRHIRSTEPAVQRTERREPSAPGGTRIPLIGLRRKIAAQMTTAMRIPHITYVEEVDMTHLEHLRRSLTTEYPDHPRPTVLPFLMGALVRAVAEHPEVNATFDDEAAILTTFGAVHVGIATQTPHGLIVPVVRDVQAMDVWQCAAELDRVTAAARDGTARRDELTGSSITITSLGALGGIVSTPIINHPEVAIVGVNKMRVCPMWDGTSFAPRTMMNLSSSFDHRIVDGWQAATFIRRVKSLLEEPSLLFIRAPAAGR